MMDEVPQAVEEVPKGEDGRGCPEPDKSKGREKGSRPRFKDGEEPVVDHKADTDVDTGDNGKQDREESLPARRGESEYDTGCQQCQGGADQGRFSPPGHKRIISNSRNSNRNRNSSGESPFSATSK